MRGKTFSCLNYEKRASRMDNDLDICNDLIFLGTPSNLRMFFCLMSFSLNLEELL